MNENEVLFSHALDLKERAADNSFITATNFLSPEQRSFLSNLEKINNKFVDTYYFGGFNEAERTVAFFVPSFYEVDFNNFTLFLKEEEFFHVSLLKATKDKFSAVNHRDYLGAIMGLGIKRELIGDIVLNGDGCHIFCLSSISDFLCENLKQAGRAQLQTVKCPLEVFSPGNIKTETVFISVSSLRLDCLISACFNLSRSIAAEYIEKGSVYLNDVQILKTDFLVKEKDKLVLRGKGKAVVGEFIGENKKGRMHLNIKKYI